MNELRHAFRQLLKHPGFATVAILTLALGIGANTMVFSVAKTLLLRPLGFPDSDQLVWLQWRDTQTGAVEDRLSWRDMEDVRENTSSFEAIGTFGVGGSLWEQGDPNGPMPSLWVTPTLVGILGVQPVVGRRLEPGDAAPGAEAVVMISHELWTSHFGERSEVLGSSIRLDGTTRTIVGVLPAGLEFPLEGTPPTGTGTALGTGHRSFWLPMQTPEGSDRTSRGARMFLPVARLKPGVTEAMARAELATLAQRLAADHPETNRHRSLESMGFREKILGHTRRGLPILGMAVAGVLLICCVNLANLLLARGVERQTELAIRVALGAGQARMVWVLLSESLLLALGGAVGGIGLAVGALHVVRQWGASSVPFIKDVSVDVPALVFTLALAFATAGIVGLIPAWRLSRMASSQSWRDGLRASGGPAVRRWQRGLLMAQVAMVMTVLVSASLLLESVRRLLAQDLGYQHGSVVALDIESWGFDTNGDVCRMYRSMRDRLAGLPGVEAVGTVSSAPLTGKWTFDEKAQVVGQSLPEAERPVLAATFVAFDYFQALGVPLREGRFFRDSELDDDGYGQRVIVNEAAARVLFPGRPAVGGRFTVGSNPDRVLEVIGVVKDTRDVRLEESPVPRFYWQYAFGGAQVVIRTKVPAHAILPRLREVAGQTHPHLRVQEVRPMSEIVSGTVAQRRFLNAMLAGYAVLALAVALVGVFGVVAQQVADRTREFGIRMALGSTPWRMMRLVLFQSCGVVLCGLLLGGLMSLGAGRLLASQLFLVSPHEPGLLMGVCLLVLGGAMAASAVPARRAARVDPMVALRGDGE